MDPWLVLLLSGFILVFLFSYLLLPSREKDADYGFHLDLAHTYLNGSYAILDPKIMSINPYPPLFHLALVPVILAGCEQSCGLVMKFLFWPLALMSSTFVSLKMFGSRIALVVLASLILSPSFFDRTYQPIPQALDFILLPLSVWFYGRNSRWFHATSLVPIYAHGAVGLILFLPFFIHSSIYKIRQRMISIVAFLSVPVVALTVLYFIPVLYVHSGFVDDLKFYYYRHPLGLVTYMGMPFIFIPLAWLLKFNRINVLFLLTLGSIMVMIPLWIDRFFQYATISVMLIAGSFLNDVAQRRLSIAFHSARQAH